MTITHPDIVRYFMTITEAAQLVLQAGGLAKAASTMLDMGEPVKIMDLANRLIRFYGYEPGVNMQVKITGLRPGNCTRNCSWTRTGQDGQNRPQQNLHRAAHADRSGKILHRPAAAQESARHNNDDVVDVLQEMVPTYHPTAAYDPPL